MKHFFIKIKLCQNFGNKFEWYRHTNCLTYIFMYKNIALEKLSLFITLSTLPILNIILYVQQNLNTISGSWENWESIKVHYTLGITFYPGINNNNTNNRYFKSNHLRKHYVRYSMRKFIYLIIHLFYYPEKELLWERIHYCFIRTSVCSQTPWKLSQTNILTGNHFYTSE